MPSPRLLHFYLRINQTCDREHPWEKGFTLIELFVIMVFIGLLAALVLPSFLSCSNRARQSESKQYIGSLNRAQQAYYLEFQQFADQSHWNALGLGIPTQTQNYRYTISGGGKGRNWVIHHAQPTSKNPISKAYLGGVTILKKTGSPGNTDSGDRKQRDDEELTVVLCEADQPIGQGGAKGTELGITFSPTAKPQCRPPYHALP